MAFELAASVDIPPVAVVQAVVQASLAAAAPFQADTLDTWGTLAADMPAVDTSALVALALARAVPPIAPSNLRRPSQACLLSKPLNV